MTEQNNVQRSFRFNYFDRWYDTDYRVDLNESFSYDYLSHSPELCDCGCNLILDFEIGMCRSCYQYALSQEDLFQNIRDLGTQKGTELGIERAIRDTIYKYPEDSLYLLDEIDIPEHVRFNKYEYTRAFENAQYDVYLKTYNIHRFVIQQLNFKHAKQNLTKHFIHTNRRSYLFEPQCIKLVCSFLE